MLREEIKMSWPVVSSSIDEGNMCGSSYVTDSNDTYESAKTKVTGLAVQILKEYLRSNDGKHLRPGIFTSFSILPSKESIRIKFVSFFSSWKGNTFEFDATINNEEIKIVEDFKTLEAIHKLYQQERSWCAILKNRLLGSDKVPIINRWITSCFPIALIQTKILGSFRSNLKTNLSARVIL